MIVYVESTLLISCSEMCISRMGSLWNGGTLYLRWQAWLERLKMIKRNESWPKRGTKTLISSARWCLWSDAIDDNKLGSLVQIRWKRSKRTSIQLEWFIAKPVPVFALSIWFWMILCGSVCVCVCGQCVRSGLLRKNGLLQANNLFSRPFHALFLSSLCPIVHIRVANTGNQTKHLFNQHKANRPLSKYAGQVCKLKIKL